MPQAHSEVALVHDKRFAEGLRRMHLEQCTHRRIVCFMYGACKTAFRRPLVDLHTTNNEAHGELPFSGSDVYMQLTVTGELRGSYLHVCNWIAIGPSPQGESASYLHVCNWTVTTRRGHFFAFQNSRHDQRPGAHIHARVCYMLRAIDRPGVPSKHVILFSLPPSLSLSS